MLWGVYKWHKKAACKSALKKILEITVHSNVRPLLLSGRSSQAHCILIIKYNYCPQTSSICLIVLRLGLEEGLPDWKELSRLILGWSSFKSSSRRCLASFSSVSPANLACGWGWITSCLVLRSNSLTNLVAGLLVQYCAKKSLYRRHSE